MVSSGGMAQVADEVRHYTGSCTGGTKRVANGIEFCLGGQLMNWLSALTWCEADGGKLAEVESLCKEGETSTCSAIKNYSSSDIYGYVNRYSNNRASRIHLQTGVLGTIAPNRPVGYDYPDANGNYDKMQITNVYAFCEPR